MRIRTNQSGSSVVELAILILVVAALGFVGYNVYNRQHNSANNSSTTTASSQASKAAVASSPQITKTSDLDKASTTLDRTDPGSSNNADTNQLDAQLANF